MNPPPIPKDKSKSKKPLMIIGIVVGCVVLGIAGIAALGALWAFTSSEEPLTDQDRELVPTIEEIALYYDDFNPSQKHVSFTKEKYIDGSIEINYEYDSPRDDEPYIGVTIAHEINSSDASMAYGIQWSAMRLGLNIGDRDFNLVENNSFYRVGEASRFGDIKYGADIYGHVLVARQGKSVYAFIISGYLLDDPELWHEIFDERIETLLAASK